MSSNPPIHATIHDPADVPAFIAYALGYRPGPGSIVIMGLRDQKVAMGACLAPEPDLATLPATAGFMAEALARNGATIVWLIAYGPVDLATSLTAITTNALVEQGVVIQHSLRVDAGRCFCLDTPPCLPADGVAIDDHSPVVAAAIYAGLTTQPDRASLVALYQPVTGPALASVAEAFDRAQRRLDHLLFDDSSDGAPRLRPNSAQWTQQAGVQAVDATFSLADQGQVLSDDDAAWLLIHLQDISVRDHAWARLTTSQAHHDLVRDLLRRAPDQFTPSPACLLAVWALMTGNGALTHIALDRAAAADPDYSLMRHLRQVADAGLPPNRIRDLFSEALARSGEEDAP